LASKLGRALVTGGAGFIGAHLVKRLLDLGTDVVILDDFSAGRLANTGDFAPGPKLRVVRGDIRDHATVKNALVDVDIVFHLAALVSVSAGENDPQLMLDVNSTGTRKVLAESLGSGVQRFVFASSAAVYGNLRAPLKESVTPSPISVYGKSKLEGERHCLRYFREKGLPTTILRFFNVYGEGQRTGKESGVLSQFARCLTTGKKPVIYGDGNQTRDFVNVDDVIDACMAVSNHRISIGKTYNVGTGKATTVRKLLSLEARMLGGRIPLEVDHRPPRKGEIEQSVAAVARLQNDLGFSAKVTLRAGLRRYLDWYLHAKKSGD
jgi:nucleoside-diphosphate-sugar epimerase